MLSFGSPCQLMRNSKQTQSLKAPCSAGNLLCQIINSSPLRKPGPSSYIFKFMRACSWMAKLICMHAGQTCVCPMLEAAIKACCRALFFREQSCCCPSPLHSSSSRYWMISTCPRNAACTRAHWALLSTWSTWQKRKILGIIAQSQNACFTK